MPTPTPPANLQQTLLQELLFFLDPVIRAGKDPAFAEELLQRAGWSPHAVLGDAGAAFLDAVKAVGTAAQTIEQAIAHPPETLGELQPALATVSKAVEAIAALPQALGSGQPPQIAEVAGDLLNLLGLLYLLRRAQPALAVLQVLTIVHAEPKTRVSKGTAVARTEGVRLRLDLARIPKLLRDPVGELRAFYMPNGLATVSDADTAAGNLMGPLSALFSALNAEVVAGRGGSQPFERPAEEAALARTMTVIWRLPFEAPNASAAAELGAAFRPIAATEYRAGLLISPFGAGTLAIPLGADGTWQLELQAQATVNAVFITPSGVELPPAASGIGEVGLGVAVEKLGKEGDVAARVGSTSGTRLEIGRLRFGAAGSFDPASQDIAVLAEVASAALIIAAGDGDGFLQKVLPAEGVRTAFDLAIGWSRSGGLAFRGSAGLDATFPIGQDIAGVLRIDRVHLMLQTDGNKVDAIAGASVSLQLGPIKAAVERFGVRATLTFPQNGGNLGPADLTVAFQPPSGAALQIDAGVVVGGGYLLFDPARQQYAGAVQLELAQTLNLTAFGLLTTRMPDGSKGFSLLVLISARFTPPLQLGYGFTLNGVGGLLGVNRTVAIEPLRAGLRAGTIGRILFPEDPIRNAPQIVSDLQTVFPPARDRFIFGPMVQLGWGTPTVLTIDLGLVLELPAPVRLFILGRMRLILPDERVAIVKLQLDALGMIDFESGDVALDAVLYDSRIQQFAITGEMALRANFGAHPDFALAVGGFHPRFQAPEGFPQLQRVTISLATGNNPRLRLEAYLALTTNTLQFGAHLELYAAAAGFSIQGHLGFDTLIQFSPFGLIVEIQAEVALKRGNTSIMSVGVTMTLTGPAPWHARGRASFKVLFFSGSIRFDVRFGQAQAPPLPPPVRLRPLLMEALRDRGNWATQLPAGEHPIVALREDPGTPEVFVHPLADLHVRQRVVPLGRELSQYGNTPIEGDRSFHISVVAPDNSVQTVGDAGVEAVTDFFAPAQFRDMTDDEKLAAPAFEAMQAGIRFVVRAFTAGPAVVESEMTYERKTVYAAAGASASAALVSPELTAASIRAAALPGDIPGEPPIPPRPPILKPPPAVPVDPRGPAPYAVRAGVVERVAAAGAAGRSALTRTGVAKYSGPVSDITVKPQRFVAVVSRVGGGVVLPTPTPDTKEPTTYEEVVEAARDHMQKNPTQRGPLKVVPSYEEVLA